MSVSIELDNIDEDVLHSLIGTWIAHNLSDASVDHFHDNLAAGVSMERAVFECIRNEGIVDALQFMIDTHKEDDEQGTVD